MRWESLLDRPVSSEISLNSKSKTSWTSPSHHFSAVPADPQHLCWRSLQNPRFPSVVPRSRWSLLLFGLLEIQLDLMVIDLNSGNGIFCAVGDWRAGTNGTKSQIFKGTGCDASGINPFFLSILAYGLFLELCRRWQSVLERHRHWISDDQADFCWIVMNLILWLCFVAWMVENVVQIYLWMLVGGRSTSWRVWIVWNVAWKLWLKHWSDNLLNSWQSWWRRWNWCVDVHVG